MHLFCAARMLLLKTGVTPVQYLVGDARFLAYYSKQQSSGIIQSPEIHYAAMFTTADSRYDRKRNVANLLLLNENPLVYIRNIEKIDKIFINGNIGKTDVDSRKDHIYKQMIFDICGLPLYAT